MNKQAIINQLKKDEGFVPVSKWDIKQFTYGYGCKAPEGGIHINEEQASKLLEMRVDQACEYFNQIFFGHLEKFNDVRVNAFVNMIFNLGPGAKGHPERGGLQSFARTLGYIFDNQIVPWGKVADELKNSKWYKQVGKRAQRICNEIKTGITA